jgi:transcriptional regulator with XRE-family HTH domain
MSPSRKRLPEAVAEHLDAHHDALAAITTGEDRTDDAVHAADQALRAAMASAPQPASTWMSPAEMDFAGIIGHRLSETRNESGWSQTQLAEAMSRYVPSWTRSTVAEIETGRRNVSHEELVILAALFAEPVVRFMIPTDDTPLHLDHASVPPAALSELLLGKGGSVGTGGRNWNVALRVANQPGARRPAPDLWKNRSTLERHTQSSQSEASKRPQKKGK